VAATDVPTTYRAAVIGCGRIGAGFDDDSRRGFVSTHAGAYSRTDGIRLVALADLDREKLDRYGRKFEVRGLYTDAAEMLAKERPDIVSVCTATASHLPLVRAAAEAGAKAVFCEKPIADSLAAADEMIRVCRDRGVLLVVDHQRRFATAHRQLGEWLRAGGLGDIQQVTSYYTAGIANSGSHLFDLLRLYIGDAAWVEGQPSRNPSRLPEDPNIDAWIGFRDGPGAVVQACDVSAYILFEIVLLGTTGRLRVSRLGLELHYELARPSERFAEYRELMPAPPPIAADSSQEYLLAAVGHIVHCLRTGSRPWCDGEDGRAALEIVCGLRESAAAGGRRVEMQQGAAGRIPSGKAEVTR
jgi:predicted dehydrogenase